MVDQHRKRQFTMTVVYRSASSVIKNQSHERNRTQMSTAQVNYLDQWQNSVGTVPVINSERVKSM